MRSSIVRVALSAMVVASLAAPAAAESATVVVTPDDLGNGWYAADTRPGGTGTFVEGPDQPPLGAGSFELRTENTNAAKVQLLTDAYDGVALADIEGIGYSSYRDSSSTGFVAGMPAINLRVDLDGDGTSDAYMVYEPYQDQGNDAVHTDEWQDWDAHAGGQATWWLSTGAEGCGQSADCTWAQILAAFPNATIREAADFPGSLGLNLGSYNAGLTTYADALYVDVAGDVTTYDFEVIRDEDGDGIPDTDPPSTKDQCKKGGYASFNNPSFRNQGQCIAYVNAN